MEQICTLKQISKSLQKTKDQIADTASSVDGIDTNKLLKITGAIDYACRSLRTLVKSYIYPKLDGPKYQETFYDDDMPGIDYSMQAGHAYYTMDAAERVLNKFKSQWRPLMLQDITADNPCCESLLGTWGMKDDGTLGILGLCGGLGASIEDGKPCIEEPLDKDIMLRLVLVRKHQKESL